MKVENNIPVLNQLQSKAKDEAKSKSSLENGSVLGSSNGNSIEQEEGIDKVSSKKLKPSKTYNRFKATNTDSKNVEFVRTTILKPGTYDSIGLSIHYGGVDKSDFRDVDVWKNTIGKTVYAISKTLNYVHNNSNTSFPTKIEFSEDYTSNGFKDEDSFYNNLNTLAQKLSDDKIDTTGMKDEISSYVNNYI